MIVKFICKNVAFVAKSVFVASIGVLFFKRWALTKLDEKKILSNRLYTHVKEKRDYLSVNRCFLERRIKNYFALFCAEGRIEVGDLSKQVQVANCNEKNTSNLRNTDLVMYACWAGLACVLIALKVFSDKQEDYNHGMLFASFLFVFVVLTVFNLRLLMECGEMREVPKKEFERLNSELKKECMQYLEIVDSVEIYNTLSSQVKSSVKRSGYLSKMIEEKILLGRLTEDESKKIEKEVMKLSMSRIGMCA